MVAYSESTDDDTITDFLNTHGVVPADFPEREIDWETGMSPSVLRDAADLVEFCYPDMRTVAVGLVESSDNDAGPALVIGEPGDDRYVMIAAKRGWDAEDGDSA